ncbi:MAG: glyoxalase/Bleomycin resistance protein [Candidatus Peregrinibacteria bacterium Greene0416_19]|nr:MAG: glyoxalase/Bleomycin resistance protein [Candidatus Peregrinibacteria bacterium Greene0416_19]
MNEAMRADIPAAEKRLGEVALRVKDMELMTEFYQTAIQLTLMRKEPHMAFFKIAGGFKGHTSILALFKRRMGDIDQNGSFDHIALSIDLSQYESEKQRLENLGLTVETAQHNWVQWRSLYVTDPEGNRIEFVCFDPSIPQNFDS